MTIPARYLLPALGVCLALAALGSAQAQTEPATPRLRIGLVLGGGGARGAAHVGVLEVLHDLHVPVDCVAGTSMGALVAGAFAAGLAPDAMRQALASADWADLFQDASAFSETSYRTKRLAQRYLPGSELGIGPDGVVAPPGVLTGQKIKLFFNQLVRADLAEQEIQTLALPLAIIATDIGTGSRVVLREGSLTLAMRASMSVPGLMAPVDYNGHKLVDGGLVDNLPVGEVRALCQPDVVIAVNVGSPLLAPEQVGSLLSVSAQMINILTEQNVSQSMARIRPTDIYIRPALEGITSGDFDKNALAAERGRQAALAVAPQLRALAADPAVYAAWAQQLAGAQRPAPVIDAVEVVGLKRSSATVVTQHITQIPGQTLDSPALYRDLQRTFGDGHYQSVDYTLVRQRERNILRVTPLEKPWGPDYLRFAVNLENDFKHSATYSIRGAYQRTALNRLGGELLVSGQVGSEMALGAELYQPLEPSQHWFVEPSLRYTSQAAPVYQDNRKMSEYDVRAVRLELATGANLGWLGQARLGASSTQGRATLATGVALLPNQSQQVNGWFASIDLDQLNRLYVPTGGWALRGRYFSAPGQNYSKLDTSAQAVYPLGRYVLTGQAAYIGSPRGTLPIFDAATLGGFLKLSGYAPGQLVGDNMRYGRVGVERIVGNLPLGLRGDMRVGVALEAARFGTRYSETQRRGMLDSAAVYLGGETPLGPVYLGVGMANGGSSRVYLFLGVP